MSWYYDYEDGSFLAIDNDRNIILTEIDPVYNEENAIESFQNSTTDLTDQVGN